MSKTQLQLLQEKYSKRDPLEFNEQEDYKQKVVYEYFVKERNLIKSYSNQLNELNKQNVKPLTQHYANKKVSEKTLNDYLKVQGLNNSDKAVNDYTKKLKNFYSTNSPQDLTKYNKESKKLSTDFNKSLKDLYTNFEIQYNKKYNSPYDYEKIAKHDQVNGVYVMKNGTKFKLKEQAADSVILSPAFQNTMEKEGFITYNDFKIPEGYVVEVKTGLFKKRRFIIVLKRWYETEEI